jgi:ATP-dependent DNA helicase RecG
MQTNWIDRCVLLLTNSLYPVPQELNELDWKSGLSGNSERLAKHISAFANHPEGGFIVFGINNDGTFLQLAIRDIEIIIQKLGNIARNNLAQPISIEHNVYEFRGNVLLFIHIPEHRDKPVYLRGGSINDSYIRSAGQTVKLSKHEIKILISESSGIHFEEKTALSYLSEDEVISLLDYDSYFSLQDLRLPDTRYLLLETLKSDDLIVLKSQTWAIFNLGAVLFAKNLNRFKELTRKSVRIIVYKDNSRLNAIKEHQSTKGYASGFEGLINYIMDQLPANEIIESALRRKVKVYPEKAIREFVANALIHQDFSVTGAGVMIEIFSDRIEITNPGIPLVDTNRFIDSAPKSRNESLASLMRRLNICEERGSGIDRAIEAIEEFQLPAPKFIRGDDYTRIILYAPVPLTRMSTEDRIRACYQHCCLYYVNNQLMNNQSVRKRFNIPRNNISFASKIITESIEAGLIKTSAPNSASKKFASYVPFWA